MKKRSPRAATERAPVAPPQAAREDNALEALLRDALLEANAAAARAALDAAPPPSAHEGPAARARRAALEARVRVAEGRAPEALELLAGIDDATAPVEVPLARVEALLETHERARAAALAEALCAREPASPWAALLLARALHRGGDALRAAQELERALRLAPDEPEALAAYGGVLLTLNRSDEAGAALERALERAPSAPRARCNLAAVRVHEQRYGDAVAALAPLGPRAATLPAALAAQARALLEACFEATRDRRCYALLEALRARDDGAGAGEAAAHQGRPGDAGRVPLATLRPQRAPRGRVLDTLGRDLVALARRGALDAVYGREHELEQLVDVLLRKKKANPVLVGPAGVGKTALVEGLAQRIARGAVPAPLREARVLELPVTELVAGSAFRGELEERVQRLLEELRGDRRTVLFIDELHVLVGAGAMGGSLDVVEALKPALARGELALIGATTAEDYERTIARDPALVRRLTRVPVDPPAPAQARAMLAAAARELAAHHAIAVDDGAIDAARALTDRFLPERAQPDKGIEALDAACVRALRAGRARCHAGEVVEAVASLAQVSLETVRAALDGAAGARAGLAGVRAALRAGVVGHDAVCDRLVELLALRAVAPAFDAAAALRPRAVVALVGPAGCGRRTVARALAAALFGAPPAGPEASAGELPARALVHVDMARLAERHELARLVGAPAGYSGYDEGGWLTRALRTAPACVVLLDAPERAHPDALALFATAFATGRLLDGRGVAVDARQAVFVLCVERPRGARAPGFAREAPREDLEASARAWLDELLGAALCARVDAVLPLAPLDAPALRALAQRWWRRAAPALAAVGVPAPDALDEATLAPLVDDAARAPQPARALARALEERLVLPALRGALASDG